MNTSRSHAALDEKQVPFLRNQSYAATSLIIILLNNAEEKGPICPVPKAYLQNTEPCPLSHYGGWKSLDSGEKL